MEDFHSYVGQVDEAVAFLAEALPVRPDIFIILGTGLGKIAAELADVVRIPYAQIPHFPTATVASHVGQLLAGRLAGKYVAVLLGRCHYYEGYSTRRITLPVRVMAGLGAKVMFIANAAGGLNTTLAPGSLMVLSDHLNFMPENPLRGPNNDAWGPRFPDLSQAYDKKLRDIFIDCAIAHGLVDSSVGVYCAISGPSLETPAETRFLRSTGADAVGMSTVSEVIVAIHAGLRVLGVSVVANVNDPDNFTPILLEDVVARAQAADLDLAAVFKQVISKV